MKWCHFAAEREVQILGWGFEEIEGRCGEWRVYGGELTVYKPIEQMPTNLRVDTPLDAILQLAEATGVVGYASALVDNGCLPAE